MKRLIKIALMHTELFCLYYCRTMIVAALTFGITHELQLFAELLIKSKSADFNPTGLFTLVILFFLDSLVFFLVGFLLAYIPSRILASFLKDRYLNGYLYVFSGLMLGILFLPICAEFEFFLFHDSDSPSYLDRYAEFSLPMLMAGVVGGYAAWRYARTLGKRGRGEDWICEHCNSSSV